MFTSIFCVSDTVQPYLVLITLGDVSVCVCSQGLLIERTGRRVLLWGGYGVMSASMIMVTVMLYLQVGLGMGMGLGSGLGLGLGFGLGST